MCANVGARTRRKANTAIVPQCDRYDHRAHRLPPKITPVCGLDVTCVEARKRRRAYVRGVSFEPMTAGAVATWAQVVPTVIVALVVDASLAGKSKAEKWSLWWWLDLLARIYLGIAIAALVALEFFLMACVSTDYQPPGWATRVAMVVLGAGLGYLFTLPFRRKDRASTG